MCGTGYLPFERAVLVVRPLMLLKSLLTVELFFAALLSTCEKHLASFIYTQRAHVRHRYHVPCMIESNCGLMCVTESISDGRGR